MKQFLVYHSDNGRIAKIATQSAEIAMAGMDPDTHSVFEFDSEGMSFVDARLCYVKNGSLADRPIWTPILSRPTIPADGATELTISGLPVAASVELYGPVSDTWSGAAGDISVAIGIPGSYTLRIDAFPYQLVEVKFNAT